MRVAFGAGRSGRVCEASGAVTVDLSAGDALIGLIEGSCEAGDCLGLRSASYPKGIESGTVETSMVFQVESRGAVGGVSGVIASSPRSSSRRTDYTIRSAVIVTDSACLGSHIVGASHPRTADIGAESAVITIDVVSRSTGKGVSRVGASDPRKVDIGAGSATEGVEIVGAVASDGCGCVEASAPRRSD